MRAQKHNVKQGEAEVLSAKMATGKQIPLHYPLGLGQTI
jgi:hypothetical protein